VVIQGVGAKAEPKQRRKANPTKAAVAALLVWMLAPALAQGQEEKVREGNKLYSEKKYKEAAAAYQQSLKKTPTYVPGAFNLGNALYQQKAWDQTRNVLNNTAKSTKDPQVKANAAYNVGNTYMQEQKWEEAINAYKSTLSANPADEQAKYNLSYARAMMKKQQQDGGGKDKKEEKDQKDKQDKDQKDKQDQKGKDQKDKDGDPDKPEQKGEGQDSKGDPKEPKEAGDKPAPQPSKLTEEDAARMLDALAQEEKKLHDKKGEKQPATQARLQKDW
jgi:tetratricopeptide (TPR) repeat protein